MANERVGNPLQGLQLAQMLEQLSGHYGWDELGEALNIERFQFHTGMKSTIKFLRTHEWAKDKLESFYLYHFKGLSIPDDKQLAIPPRNRKITGEWPICSPAVINAQVLNELKHIAAQRTYETVKADPKVEPNYDPSNPWNQ